MSAYQQSVHQIQLRHHLLSCHHHLLTSCHVSASRHQQTLKITTVGSVLRQLTTWGDLVAQWSASRLVVQMVVSSMLIAPALQLLSKA